MLDPDEEQPGIPLFPISHGLSRAPVKRVPLRRCPSPVRSNSLLAIAISGLLATYSANSVASEQPGTVLHSQAVVKSLDWHPLETLPADQHDRRCRQCGGAFIDPLANRSTVDPASANIDISASDSSVTESAMTFEGDVTVAQGHRTLRADRLRIDRAQQVGVAEGNVTLREKGVVVRGEQATYDSGRQYATVTDARFALHDSHMTGSATQLARSANGQLAIVEGSMTYCAPDNPRWYLSSRQIDLDPSTGVGEARDAKLYIGDTPVFYVPWIQFPIDERRKTGVLWPDIGSDTRGGLDVTVPIYINLAAHYDATYSPRYIAERGLNHQINSRYLGDTLGSWEVNGAYLGSDKKYKADAEDGDGTRWLVGVKQTGTMGTSWRTRLNYTRVSDGEYIRDLNNQQLSSQRQTALMQLGQLDYLGEDWLVRVQAQAFQSLVDDIGNDYKKLPQVTAQWRGDTRWLGLQPIALAQYSRFEASDERTTGQRLYTDLGLSYPMNWLSGFVTPTVSYRHLSYRLDESLLSPTNAASNEEPSAHSATASLDAGLRFERPLSLAGEGFTQTLEPRLFYLYSQYDAQGDQPDFDSAELTFSFNQLYRDTRFSGYDRLDDAHQASVGITTRLFANSDGRERLNASIGQIYYFDDRRVRLNASDAPLTDHRSAVAAQANWLPTENWTLRSSLLYDSKERSFDAASLHIGYRPGNGSVFNAGYTLREPPPSQRQQSTTEQANFSTYFTINDNWRLFAAFEYSIEASLAVEELFGVEYDDCCWQVRALYMRYVDTDGRALVDFTDPQLEREDSLQFQFVLKGMGGIGNRVDNLLGDMIRGFQDRY